MQSFVQYRKNQLQNGLFKLTVKEAIDLQFDILKMEILSAVKLPAILTEGNFVTKSAYEKARIADYQDNKEIVEFIIQSYKTNLYKEILAEAGETKALTIDDFKKDLQVNVKNLVNDLRNTILQAVRSSRPTTDSISTAPVKMGSTEKPKIGPEEKLIQPKRQKEALPIPNEKKPSSGVEAKPITISPTSKERPLISRDGKTYQPAPYGSLKPHDTWLGGLKRSIYDPVAGWLGKKFKTFRQRWHDDPLREHNVFLETIFLEGFLKISDLLSDFETKLVDLVSSRVEKILTAVGGKVVSEPTSGLVAPPEKAPETKIKPEVGPEETMEVKPRGEGKPINKEDPAQIAANPTGIKPPDPVEKLEEKDPEVIEKTRTPAVKRAAEKLGIILKSGISDLKPSDVTNQEGAPFVVGKQKEGEIASEIGWNEIKRAIIARVWSIIQEKDPQLIQNFQQAKFAAKKLAAPERAVRNTLDYKEKFNLISQWVNHSYGKQRKGFVDFLVALDVKFKEIDAGKQTPSLNVAASPAEKPVAPSGSGPEILAPKEPEKPISTQPEKIKEPTEKPSEFVPITKKRGEVEKPNTAESQLLTAFEDSKEIQSLVPQHLTHLKKLGYTDEEIQNAFKDLKSEKDQDARLEKYLNKLEDLEISKTKPSAEAPVGPENATAEAPVEKSEAGSEEKNETQKDKLIDDINEIILDIGLDDDRIIQSFKNYIKNLPEDQQIETIQKEIERIKGLPEEVKKIESEYKGTENREEMDNEIQKVQLKYISSSPNVEDLMRIFNSSKSSNESFYEKLRKFRQMIQS